MQVRWEQLAARLLLVAAVISIAACERQSEPVNQRRTTILRPVVHQQAAKPTWSQVEQRASELESRVNELEHQLR